jgi:membrane protease YdiL (CAAX protease family)
LATSVLNYWPHAAATALGLAWFAAAWIIFARIVARLRGAGGEVRAENFALPDLLVTIVLASSFIGLLIKAAMRHEQDSVAAGDVLPSALAFGGLVICLVAFLKFRRLSLIDLFGLRRLAATRVAGWAGLLLLCSFPFVAAANAVTVLILKDEAKEQGLVELFRSAAQRGDFSVLAAIAFVGVIVAPVCEEFLFRGYFYGVGKRYIGPWISGLLTAFLFAAFHGSLTALPGLFLLAIALTLACERTGTLLVPMTMHALFNSISLGVMYLQATDRLPA